MEGQCEICGAFFEKRQKSQKYCSPDCRRAAKVAYNRQWREDNGVHGWSRCEICGERCPHGWRYCAACRRFLRDDGELMHREIRTLRWAREQECAQREEEDVQ